MSPWSFQCWEDKNLHLSFPRSRDVVSTLRVWAVLRHSIPWPCEAEIPCLSWLLAAPLCFDSRVSAFLFSSPGVRELSLCKTEERGVDCSDIRNRMPWCMLKEAVHAKRVRVKSLWERVQLSLVPGFSGPCPLLPHVIGLSIGIWFSHVDGRTQGFLSGVASCDAVSSPCLIKPEPASH